MTKADLEKQHETGLVSILSNDCMPEELKVYAAVLLYKRGSRFLGFQEYQPYKERVLDYLLDEYAATPPMPFAPNTHHDVSGRIHSRTKDATDSVARAHEALQKHREEFLRGLADHDQEFSKHDKRIKSTNEDITALDEEIAAQIESTNNSLFLLGQEFARFKKKTYYLFGGVAVLNTVLSYVVHHFLR